MITHNGVIASSTKHFDGSYLLTQGGAFRASDPARTLERLLYEAEHHALDALWVLPGSVESWHAGNGPGDPYFESMTHSTALIGCRPYVSEGKITCLHIWNTFPQGNAKPHEIRIFFPEHDERWQLQDVRNPQNLLATINLVESGLGVYLDYSPGSTGKHLMKSLNRGPRSSWLAPIDFMGTPWLPTEEQLIAGESVPLSGSGTRLRPPTLDLYDMTAPLWFHAYDKKYGFGGAMSSVYIGAGRPLHTSGAPAAWSNKVPGIWRLPNRKWMYTPEMHYLLQEGYIAKSQITEGYIWPNAHQTMRSFADLMWDFDVLAEGNPAARRVGKQIRSIAFGWLAMDTRQWRDDPESASVGDFYRPDVWGAVVSELRAKMNYEMNRLWGLGYEPIWWNCDELGFFSNDPNPLTAVPIVTRTGKGAFCHRYTLPVDDDILFAFLEQRKNGAAGFARCHELLLSKWHAQQQITQEETMLVPAVVRSA